MHNCRYCRKRRVYEDGLCRVCFAALSQLQPGDEPCAKCPEGREDEVRG